MNRSFANGSEQTPDSNVLICYEPTDAEKASLLTQFDLDPFDNWRISYGLFSLAMILLGWVIWWWLKKILDRHQTKERRQAASSAH